MDKLQRLYEQIEQAPAYSKEIEDFKLWVLAMIKKAMEAQDEDQSNVVNRQAVLDQTYLWSKDEFLRVTNPFDYLRKRINALPPVTPKPTECEDCVNREDVKSALCELCGNKNSCPFANGDCDDLNAINALSSVTPESKWVPVDYDRYPETYPKPFQEVWITDEYGEVQCQVYNGTRSIKAWMPYVIPKPYKEGENE